MQARSSYRIWRWQRWQEAEPAGGKVILPDYSTLKSRKTEHAIAPNRFVAEFPDEAAAVSAAKRASDALLAAWKQIAEDVWKGFLINIATQDSDTRDIWDRQIANFWEIAWAVGDQAETDLLDRRKNWRSPPQPSNAETIAPSWDNGRNFPVLSDPSNAGTGRFLESGAGPGATALDLGSRRTALRHCLRETFLSAYEGGLGRELDMQNWPSTVSIAAVPWLRLIKDKPDVHAAAKMYAELADNEPGARVSSARRIAALENFPPAAGSFAELSGNFLNHTALQNKRGTPLKDNGKDRRKLLLEKLGELEKATGDHAGNFYGLLLMDGDGMGALIREHTAEAVTPCLTKFASKVPKKIEDERHSGICIYAGGDDLLAMLPLDHALDAVTAVRELYVRSFGLEEARSRPPSQPAWSLPITAAPSAAC